MARRLLFALIVNAPLLMISDDEPCIGVAMRRALRSRGVEVVLDTQAEVVPLSSHHRPDAILLDLLHRRDGLVLLRELKQCPETRDIPVYLMSALFDPDAPSDPAFSGALQLGAQGVVPKPLPAGFIDHLTAVARTRHASRQAANDEARTARAHSVEGTGALSAG